MPLDDVADDGAPVRRQPPHRRRRGAAAPARESCASRWTTGNGADVRARGPANAAGRQRDDLNVPRRGIRRSVGAFEAHIAPDPASAPPAARRARASSPNARRRRKHARTHSFSSLTPPPPLFSASPSVAPVHRRGCLTGAYKSLAEATLAPFERLRRPTRLDLAAQGSPPRSRRGASRPRGCLRRRCLRALAAHADAAASRAAAARDGAAAAGAGYLAASRAAWRLCHTVFVEPGDGTGVVSRRARGLVPAEPPLRFGRARRPAPARVADGRRRRRAGER